jgi:hypothetical protein
MAILKGRFVLTVALLVFSASTVAGQDNPEALLGEAENIYEGPDSSLSTLAKVRALLDRIVQEHPSSDLAVSVLLAEPVGGIDLVGLNARLENGSVSESSAPEDAVETMQPESSPTKIATIDTAAPLPLTPGSETSELALELTRDMRREVQRRLTLIGHDTKGVDGSLGKNSRKAIIEWQVANKLVPTGYLNDSQLSALKRASADEYDDWEKKEASKPKKKKRRVKLCKRGFAGILYDCRYVWR